MEYEYDMLKSFADKRNGIKLYKNLILNGCSLIEFGNDKYDPFKFKLSGWSEHMNLEVDNYDDVLEELYEKYRGAGGTTPPEVKLILLVLASASAFHFSKNFENKIPGLNKIYTNNAGVIPGMLGENNKQQQQFMSPQEYNIKNQREEMIRDEKDRKMKNRQQSSQNRQPPQNYQQPSSPQNNQSSPQNYQQSPQNNTNENYQNSYYPVSQNDSNFENHPTINKSEDVNEILNRLHGYNEDDDTENESSVNNDRIVSDTTLSDGGTRRKKNKPMMVIT
jgi:hypothetical protein